MKRSSRWVLLFIVAMLFVGAAVAVQDADARAGGGRSFGRSGSRSFGAPSRSYSSPRPASPSQQPGQPPAQPAGGGFLRSMGGGILGGLLGGMLFSSLGFGGTGGGFGGGIGIFEIILFAGIGYVLFTMIRKRREAAPAYEALSPGIDRNQGSYATLMDGGLDQFRRVDPSFDESRFKEAAMDNFFKIQGCWTNRNLSAGHGLLTDEMDRIFQDDIDKLLKDKKSNKLENIAVRKVEIVEAWQESGLNYVKVLLTANLLDYTIDDRTGDVVAGSKTDPVKFEEYWSFVGTIGSNDWKLTAIGQV